MIQCPSCSGGLKFDIPSQQMLCEHCGNRYDPSQFDDRDKDNAKTYDCCLYNCPSCGGELLATEQTDAIGYCPFCGGASMLFGRMKRQWRPDYIIPFKITKDQCKELYKKEARRSPFTSKKYRDPRLIEGFRGIYMPYWLYQGQHLGPFTLTGSKKGFFIGKDYQITGSTDVTVDGYAHDASRAFDDRISENLAPYDIREQKPFYPGYLSGFYADIGDVDKSAYNYKGSEFMKQQTARLMGTDERIAGKGLHKIKIDEKTAQIPTKVTSAKRVLYPVWFMSYRDGDKLTYAAVNGQTGKVCADLPASPLKIMIAVLIVAALLAGAMFILPSIKANATLLVTVILLIAGVIILRKNYRSVVNPSTGLDKTEEAKKFSKHDKRRLLLIIISCVLAILLAFADVAYNYISYGASLFIGLELFYMMYCHIRFQVEIARRRPPQFNKKGAYTDEK